MNKEKTIRASEQNAAPARRLLVCSFVQLGQDIEPIELQRGMPICTLDGVQIGAVAAVVLDCQRKEVGQILLGYVPPTTIYRLIALNLIDRIEEGAVRLRVTSADADELPIYQPDG